MRVRSLDALRGLAALAVVVSHWHDAFPPWTSGIPSAFSREFWKDPFGILLQHTGHIFNLGGSAVIVFFVLSGFVLALSLEAPDETYGRFVIKRVFRIWPPLAFVVLLSAGLYFLVPTSPIPQLSDWFNVIQWTTRPDAHLLVMHLAMIGIPPNESLDTSMWSLVHEMRISLVFPLIAIATARSPRIALSLSLTASMAALAFMPGPEIAASWLRTVHYTVLFFFGAALAHHRNAVSRWIVTRDRLTRSTVWLIALGCLFMPPEFLHGWMMYVVALGAVLIVALCFADPRAISLLEGRAAVYLGRISYSLYLIHVPLLLAFLHGFYGMLPAWLIVALSMPCTILAADATYRWVERPSQKLGRALAGGKTANDKVAAPN
jgi:peptidoglycan/LPS O-acetylase OafA/YrhL